jgi:hypothetical protein
MKGKNICVIETENKVAVSASEKTSESQEACIEYVTRVLGISYQSYHRLKNPTTFNPKKRDCTSSDAALNINLASPRGFSAVGEIYENPCQNKKGLTSASPS